MLEQELSVFDRRERPDYQLLQAVIKYCKEFPDRCHHPKEDMILQLVRQRDPAAAARTGDLEAEHAEEERRLRRFSRVIDSILIDRELERQIFDKVRDFIAFERRHAELEERLLFPAALVALRPEDWASLDAHLDDAQDPLFNGTMQEEYASLRQKLRWEEENQEIRV